MSRVCGVCDEPLTDAGVICHGDARRLALALRDVPELVRELDVTITRRAKVTHRSGPARLMELDPVRLEFDVRASDALTHLAGSLRSWAANLAEDTGDTLGCKATVQGHALWLAARASVVRMRDWAPDLYTEVMDAVKDATRAIDAPPDLAFMGHCPTPDPEADGYTCGTELWVKPGAVETDCRACGRRVDVQELRASLVEDAAHHRAPAKAIAAALADRKGRPLTVARIYLWRHRGLIAPVGVDPSTGADLYRLGDVADLLARMEARTPPGIIRPKGAKK